MSRRFEQEYSRANDRIHPRKELRQELERAWAAEEAREARERRKTAAFPAWAKFTAMAAGVLLCIGLGMGSVLLYSRSQGLKNRTASAQRTEITAAGTADMAAETVQEEQLAYDTAEAEEDLDQAPMEAEAPAEEPKTMLAAAAPLPPEGTHFALDEAEVEDSLR